VSNTDLPAECAMAAKADDDDYDELANPGK